MDMTILPCKLSGTVTAPPSKSCAHRALICAATATSPTQILCGDTGRDVQATVTCLRALGANIRQTENGWQVQPIVSPPAEAVLPCGESGSTLRFLLPLAGALGVDAIFTMEGRLPCRPLSPLWEEMERMGCQLSRPSENSIRCCGKLTAGEYHMKGTVSSQFISGLMMALPLIGGSRLSIDGPVHSRPYAELTSFVMAQFPCDRFQIEGDWSSAAFFLAANALGSQVRVNGLSESSLQADKEILPLLEALKAHCTVSARDIPDLIPVLAVVASCRQGAVFTDIARLRQKESDRVAAVAAMLTALGGHCAADDNTLTVYPAHLTGGTVDSFCDHRIAMAAVIASTVCTQAVTVRNAQCTDKSYPRFWEDYQSSGGQICPAAMEIT